MGAWFLFTVDSANGGTLRDHGPGTILATNVLGNMIRLNTIHNMNAGALYVYVNGVLVETKTGGTTPFYDKYGTYRAASGYGPVTAQWTNVRLWTGGSTNASASGTFTNPPGITSIKLIGQNIVLTGTNGQSGDAYYLLQSKNAALPLSQLRRFITIPL